MNQEFVMELKIVGQISAPPIEATTSLERYCRVKLPQDFIEFLQYGNGGIPEKNLFMHEGTDRLIERFLPVMLDPNSEDIGEYDISVVMTALDSRLGDDPDEIGCKLIPFAALFSGDFLCLDFRKNAECPEVVLWDHNQSDDFAPHTEPVAPSFADFKTLLFT